MPPPPHPTPKHSIIPLTPKLRTKWKPGPKGYSFYCEGGAKPSLFPDRKIKFKYIRDITCSNNLLKVFEYEPDTLRNTS